MDVQPLGDLAETLGRLLRNTVFRLSLMGALLFGVSLLVAQGIVYDRIVSSEVRRIQTQGTEELNELLTLAEINGKRAVDTATISGLLPKDPVLAEAQARQLFEDAATTSLQIAIANRTGDPQTFYLFRLGERRQNSWQGRLLQQEGRAEDRLIDPEDKRLFRLSYLAFAPESEDPRRFEAVGQTLSAPDGSIGYIVVAKDVEAIMRTGDRMVSAMLGSSLIALLLGILSSIFVARRFAARVEQFNEVANDVRAGNLDRRAPRNYSEDEMDLLAEHLNGMLDHIDTLMKAMRYAGDSVAHDLRTPLTRLRTRLETAAVEAGDRPEADVLYAAAGDADELLLTFDSVLRIARLEAGEKRDLLKPTDPKGILDDLAELYEPACEDAGLAFTYDIADGLLILADRGLLSQAVSNLLENAIKYAGGGGGSRIHLSAYKGVRGRTHVCVADDGPGIPVFDRDRVKERFVRLDKSRTLPGSGLGLALVDAVAELHNAELVMDDGLGMDDALTEGEGGEDRKPGLRVELVFPRVKAVKVSARESAETAMTVAEAAE